MDKEIKAAADNHFPAYDDKAWEKMEVLLDKHLPQQKDDKRRIFFLLFLFLLFVGGGVYLLISHPWKSGKTYTDNKQSSIQHIDQPKEITNKAKLHSDDLNANISSKQNKNDKSKTDLNEDNSRTIRLSRNQYIDAAQEMINKKLKKTNNKRTAILQPENNKTTGPGNKQEDNNKQVISSYKKDIAYKDDLQKIAGNEKYNLNTEPEKGKNSLLLKPGTDILKTDNISKDEKEITPALAKPAPAKKRSNSLFFSLSAGPDLSTVGTKEIGRITLSYGVSVGFTFRDKFTVRTGVFTSRKIYTASPDVYNPPPAFWTYYPNLKKVNADCNVIEIPFLLSYKFNSAKNHSYSLATGISTYLMKRETYEYYYTNSGGQPAYRKYTYNDVNKHYFSVLTLAGGYQRKINKTFSLSIEPFIKVPLDGIGYGKVHLNSAGILISTNMKLFSAEKRK